MSLDILGLSSSKGKKPTAASTTERTATRKSGRPADEGSKKPQETKRGNKHSGNDCNYSIATPTTKPLLDRDASEPPSFWASVDSTRPFGSELERALYFFRVGKDFEISDRIAITPLPGVRLDCRDALDFFLKKNVVMVRQISSAHGCRKPLTGWIEPILARPHPHPAIPLDWTFAFYPDREFLGKDVFPEAMLITAAMEAAVFVRLTGQDPVRFVASCFSAYTDPPAPRYRYGL